ncbi:BnaCnng65720D [Brassica napus]|uniref:BnaCnng65720D protein n=1 Tax=Brassica napus TaxID=3708 RepID=A0A078JWD9_BRANA|nr:BnaCnng65720D [Brassica napus]
MHDNHCDGRTPNARFWEKVDSMAGEGPYFSKSANILEVDVSTPIGPEIVSKPAKPTLPEPLEVNLRGGEGGDESPISGINLLAEEVEKGTRSENVYKDPQENTCRMLTVWSHPESYVLPPEEQGGKAKRSFKSFSQFSARNRHSKLKFEIVIGIHVSNKFFLSLARPTNWVSTEFAEFEKASDKLGFNWGGLVSFSFTGKTPRRNDKKVLLVDVDRVYAPMMWGKDHWVCLVINLTCRQVEILDCNIPLNKSDNEVNKHMAYLLRALHHVLAAFSPPSDSSHPEEDQAFSWVRPDNIYFNERSGDCGPCAVKFLEMHAAGYSYEDMGQIDDKKVDIFRQKYAMDTYEEFIGNAKVQNNG